MGSIRQLVSQLSGGSQRCCLCLVPIILLSFKQPLMPRGLLCLLGLLLVSRSSHFFPAWAPYIECGALNHYSLVLFFPLHMPQTFMEISLLQFFLPFPTSFSSCALYLSSPSVFPQLLQSYCYILSPWMATTPSCHLYVTEANYFFISFIALLC